MNGVHREAEKITAGSTVVVAASGRPLKGLVDGGRDLEREHGVRELEFERNKAKTERCRYLRMRWVVAELEVTSASRFGHRSGGLPSSGGELRAAVGERRKGGARLGAL